MSVSVRIPTPLRSFADGVRTVDLDSDTVGGALAALVERYPRLGRHLYGESGELRTFVNVYVNEDNTRDLHGIETALARGDTITIVPSIAGG